MVRAPVRHLRTDDRDPARRGLARDSTPVSGVLRRGEASSSAGGLADDQEIEQDGASGSGAGLPRLGMPRPTPFGAVDRPSHASPERVRRTARTGPSAIKWCGAAWVMVTVDRKSTRLNSSHYSASR